ncbi:serine/threonine protein kinase [Streptomyces halstedii]|uniref:Serine/threonine protein kinase n=1 Tax=Streptomyces halstedii TaxID=1944 RepID=A0ABS6TQM5_STRHA|nr:serine/threonine-protein kinase [Streptomyces halstedii]MBV7670580.1 serine/threonine protein kinase [Streptomyces halstedii]
MSHPTRDFQPLQDDDPPVVAGYRFAARLGAGGMGRVYLSHTRGGRPVAIKVVRPELADDPGFRRRFGREIEAARRVRGAYTAELIDADADGVPPWLATLYVPGPSLTEAVARRGPLPVPAVLWLMAGVAEALQAIHAEGIVHRDLKPSNVLLAADGPRVIDFGIALAGDATSYTATGDTIGTPFYMAPEQASGDEVTAAADVFALGQTAAFAVLGRPLYGDGPAVNVLYRIVHSAPDLSVLPESLRPLFARCLAADPAERISPAEVVEWCRQRLGAEAGGGPAVWKEITGPEAERPVPAPIPEPTLTPTLPHQQAHEHAPVHPQPLFGRPQPTPPPSPSPSPEERRARRRRTALLTAAGVTGGALLVVVLAWSVMEAKGLLDDRITAGSGPSASGTTAQPSASAPGSSSGSDSSSEASDTSEEPGSSGAGSGSDGDPASGDADTASSEKSSRDPRPEGFTLVSLDADNSLSLKSADPKRTNRKGDIHFDCTSGDCQLKSDTTVLVQIFGSQGTTLDECRLMLRSAKKAERTSLSLAASAAGTEICMQDTEGNIGLYTIQTKSTAVPELGFLQGDLTVWRDAAR